MNLIQCFLGLLISLFGSIYCESHYLNQWAVKIDGNIEDAERIARQNGYLLETKLDGFDNVFIMKKLNLRSRMKRHILNFTDQLLQENSVLWAEQQMVNIRVKRNVLPELNNLETSSGESRGFIRNLFDATRHFIFSVDFVKSNNMLNKFNDELWPYQWYMHANDVSRFDHGITQVWEMGFTGRGIVVSVLDDGIEWKHTDLRANYDHNASFDMNDNDNDPTPRYDIHNTNGHGTRCAGEIAMSPQNVKCGIGIAYNSKIGGIRCLDGEVSDLLEARSLAFKSNYIDIYSSSWGPNDDGQTVDGPKPLTSEALERGTTYGRSGRGSIFIWASGNGGSKGDNCNCDGYVSSIYTISIGSVSESGSFPWYGEKCASTLAVAYSSGAYNDKKIATTDINNACTIEHSGTSAAAPIAAGIAALVLEANPNLTWRDMQHLIVCTAEFIPVADNKGWKRNAAGFMFNSRFGFGMLMADSMVKSALNWKTVPPKTVCTIHPEKMSNILVDQNTIIKVIFNNVDTCGIKYLEHVQVNINLSSSRRGSVRIFLVSPHETLTVLMNPRPHDESRDGFFNWNLTSVQLWGENPKGTWRLYVQNAKKDKNFINLNKVRLILHGISQQGGCLKEKTHRRYISEELISTIIDQTPEYIEESEGFLNFISKPISSFFQF